MIKNRHYNVLTYLPRMNLKCLYHKSHKVTVFKAHFAEDLILAVLTKAANLPNQESAKFTECCTVAYKCIFVQFSEYTHFHRNFQSQGVPKL